MKEKEDAAIRAELFKMSRQEEKEKVAIELERKRQKKAEDAQFKARQTERAAKGVLVLKIKYSQTS